MKKNKLIILCAGENSHVSFIRNKPKCLYKVNGKEPLLRTIESFKSAGFEDSDIRIVVGYEKKQIIRFLKRKKIAAEVIENKNFNASAIYSVKVGLEGLEKLNTSAVITLGDEHYHPEIMKQIIAIENDLVCFERKPNPNVPCLNIFKIAPSAMPLFSSDVYLTPSFFSQERELFKEYYKINKETIPPYLPAQINSGYAMGFMNLHAVAKLKRDFPERVTLLPNHDLYEKDLDHVFQTDLYKKNWFFRLFTHFYLKKLIKKRSAFKR